jgi:HlyD family secretion protein
VQHQVFDYNSVMLKSKFSSQGQLIYIILICSLLIVIASTYFLKTTISIKSQGILQSTIEKADVQIPVNGKIVALI